MSADFGFSLPDGIDIPDVSGLKNAYSGDGDGNFTAVLSAELIGKFISDFTGLIPEPIFFFIELPCTSDEEKELRRSSEDGFHYRLYYLDNCTRPVISAIIKEYGHMLISDGLCRFGFGGNESGDEIYLQTYKVISLYTADPARTRAAEDLLSRAGAERTDELVTPWEIISKDNPGTCALADEDGITPYDLPELLKEAGMYFAEIV